MDITTCVFQQFFQEVKSDFYKPVSCHLYPIRIKKAKINECLNYERIEHCKGGCLMGKKVKIPLLVFAKSALIRKYGTDYYEALLEIRKYYFT